MTNYALSKYFGFKPYYFGSIQCNNLDRYNKIMSYDDNKILSVKKYADHINSLVFKMKEIVEFYENKTWLFGKTLVDNNIYLNRGKTQIYLEVYASIMYFKCDLIGFLSASSASIERWQRIIALLYKKLFLKKLLLFIYRSKRN